MKRFGWGEKSTILDRVRCMWGSQVEMPRKAVYNSREMSGGRNTDLGIIGRRSHGSPSEYEHSKRTKRTQSKHPQITVLSEMDREREATKCSGQSAKSLSS